MKAKQVRKEGHQENILGNFTRKNIFFCEILIVKLIVNVWGYVAIWLCHIRR